MRKPKINQEKAEEMPDYWSIPTEQLYKSLNSSEAGLSSDAAEECLDRCGPNVMVRKPNASVLNSFILQFKNPIILLLLFSAVLSAILGDITDAIIIIVIVFLSSVLDLFQEYRATGALQKLLSIIEPTVMVLRDGNFTEIKSADVVPGDIVSLSAGKNIPADSVILDAKDFFINEATLTGESYPAEKRPGISEAGAGIAKRLNGLFMGTSVGSGSGKALVVKTETCTEFGKISEKVRLRPPETEFEHVTRRFGYFLMQITMVMVIIIFVVNVGFNPGQKKVFDSFLFALALAVGMTPQLLPAIISITLAHGAKKMAAKKVIVKRLNSIENFGSLNILCSDKTGTLTEGTMKLESTLDYDGDQSEKVLLYSYLNAYFESGFVNPIDEAIREEKDIDVSAYTKLDEIPYDFIRKRLSILVTNGESNLLICKGALQTILDVCTQVETGEGTIISLYDAKETIQNQYERLSNEGFRVLAVAYRDGDVPNVIEKEEETNMTFLGFIYFADPLREDVIDLIKSLNNLGIKLKIITGDSGIVAKHIAGKLNIENAKVLLGPDIRKMSDEALARSANFVDIFAEVEPNQKERIILALKKHGNVVGFIGDGINDASALHAADVGISVNNAVDVAKEAADIILLEKHLDVVLDGIIEGRKTFANTLKYIFITTSANFGNTFTMAGASMVLPILPMLPEQVLLTNLLTDFPNMNVATDNVDPEQIEQPRKWSMKFIMEFMLVFGITSSIFDIITFIILYVAVGFNQIEFSTGWFIESTLTELFVTFIIRTRRPFYRSKPSGSLAIFLIAVAVAVVAMPYIPAFNTLFSFSPPPLWLLGTLLAVVAAYVFSNEIAKKLFYRKIGDVF